MTAGIRLYRVYYNVYDDSVHRNIVEALKESLGAKVVDKPSKVLKEFRHVEIMLGDEGREDDIKKIVESAGSVYGVKVEWIDTTK